MSKVATVQGMWALGVAINVTGMPPRRVAILVTVGPFGPWCVRVLAAVTRMWPCRDAILVIASLLLDPRVLAARRSGGGTLEQEGWGGEAALPALPPHSMQWHMLKRFRVLSPNPKRMGSKHLGSAAVALSLRKCPHRRMVPE